MNYYSTERKMYEAIALQSQGLLRIYLKDMPCSVGGTTEEKNGVYHIFINNTHFEKCYWHLWHEFYHIFNDIYCIEDANEETADIAADIFAAKAVELQNKIFCC
jgi:hypothetical protein